MHVDVLPELVELKPEEIKGRQIRYLITSSYWLRQGEARLDARFYAQEVFAARCIIEESGFKTKPLQELATEIFYPARFKRIPSLPREGLLFLTAKELFFFRPQAKSFVSKDNTPSTCICRPGWLLVSRSGTVGRIALMTKRLANFAITDDAIRIVPKDPNITGYLYAFLSSSIGQPLITKDQYGSAIKHLEPHHLASLPVPLLPEAEQQAIHERVMEAYQLRDEANELLDKAESLFYKELGLPHFDERQIPYLSSQKPKAFIVQASELADRLDASFHIPIAKAAVKVMKQGKYPLTCLSELAERIFIPPRFKRIYVEPRYGVPLLQGSHIPMMKPYGLKFISRWHTAKLKLWIIHKGWVLVTRSGTIGRVSLVPSAWDNWAASEHLLRVIPDPDKAHSGYIAAFLISPYGQYQLSSKIYGGVVDELTEEDTASLNIPAPPLEVQEKIGKLVVEAFEKKEQANFIEQRAISRFEASLQRERSSYSLRDLLVTGGAGFIGSNFVRHP